MRKVIFTLMGLTASLVMGDMGVCQKNCGIDYGKCLILQGDMQLCLRQEAACALDCLKGVKLAAKLDKPFVAQVDPEDHNRCNKNCAIDFGECLVLTNNRIQCMKVEVACALECLRKPEVEASHSVKAKSIVTQVDPDDHH